VVSGGAPRALVFGTGALGCLFGARLARSGMEVTVIGSWQAALDALGRRGATVIDHEGRWSAPVHVRRIPAVPLPAPLALVLVKAQQTALIAPVVAGALSPGGLAVTLQNGLGNRESLEAALGAGRVLPGITVVGAALAEPGVVRATPGRVVLGTLPGREEAVARLAQRLEAAGFGVEVTAEIDVPIWRKLAANCAINALSALRAVPNGVLLDDAGAHPVIEAAAREVAAVAAARGVDLGTDPMEMTLEVLRRTASNRSSMLQDVEHGRPTEVEALNGAVVREGRRLGVPTPANEELWRAVLALSESTRARIAEADQ
jgi:2-dehydropantoate 2-reductase